MYVIVRDTDTDKRERECLSGRPKINRKKKKMEIVDGNNLFVEYASDYYHADNINVESVYESFFYFSSFFFVFIPDERAALHIEWIQPVCLVASRRAAQLNVRI